VNERQQQERTSDLCAGLLRAWCGDASLHFRGQRLHRGRMPVPWFAPHLHPTPGQDDFSSFRGAADGLALRLTRSDAALHDSLRPADPLERMIFEMLEQFRVESLAPPDMPGMRQNLRHRNEAWSLAYHHQGHTDTVRGLILYTVAQISRSRVCAEPVLELTEDLMEATRFALAPRLGHDLAGMRRHRHEQAAYAQHARSVAAVVAGMLVSADDAQDQPEQDGAKDERLSVFSLVQDMEREVVEQFASAASGRSVLMEGEGAGYRVFTRAYDQELAAASLVRPALLAQLREQLDRRVAAQAVNIGRLARALQGLLSHPEADDWDSGQEEGRIDGRRLSQLVAKPTERRLFRTERYEPRADCAVTLLIDCSGSMKAHAESVAMLADVLARALEQAGVACEVLGFTTGAWNGGRALREWQREGRPAHPGRLNERRHIVFKDADASWRRARPSMAALLKPDLFREGIDGEALEWACARLAARPESRRLVLVVSDGSPMDSATALANDDHYLDHHLQDVVARHEQLGDIAIAGVGVGLDLSPYYRVSHVLDFSRARGQAVFAEILRLIARRLA